MYNVHIGSMHVCMSYIERSYFRLGMSLNNLLRNVTFGELVLHNFWSSTARICACNVGWGTYKKKPENILHPWCMKQWEDRINLIFFTIIPTRQPLQNFIYIDVRME